MISSEPPTAAVAPLPVWPTIAEAYLLLFRQFPDFAKIAVIPTVLSLGLWITVSSIGPPFPNVVLDILIELPWTLLGVAWLRWLLLSNAGAKAGFFSKLRRRHLRFLAYSLLLTLIDLPLYLFPFFFEGDLAAGLLGTAAFWGLALAAMYFELRFAFIYVATAADENYSLLLAWRHSRGQSLRLFLIVFVAAFIPWRIFNYLLESISVAPDHVGGNLAILVGWYCAFWMVQGLYLTIVALAFRTLTGWVPAPDQSLIERFE